MSSAPRPSRTVACPLWLAAALALAAAAGCGNGRSADEVLRDLTAAAEEMDALLAEAETLEDLETRGERLRQLAGLMRSLQAEARAAGEASPYALERYGHRLQEALDSIAATLADWSREEKWDMLDYADDWR